MRTPSKVFLACPIGEAESPDRARSDKLLKYVIHPVVRDIYNLEPESIVMRSDTMAEPGRITVQILRELTSAELVIADVTETNPNVMYEIGVRQATLRPLVLMAEKGQRLPFDLNDLRTVFYELELEQVDAAKAELRTHMETARSQPASAVDRALFGATHGGPGGETSPSQDLLAILEVCQNILRDGAETRNLITAVGQIALQTRSILEAKEQAERERNNQEIGMRIMSELLKNPEGLEKVIPAMQALAAIGNKQPEQPVLEVPQNRAARRRNQRKVR